MFSGKEKLLFRILHLTIIPCKAFGEMHGVKEALLPSKSRGMQGMCCSVAIKPVAQCTLQQQTVKVTCSSMWLDQ